MIFLKDENYFNPDELHLTPGLGYRVSAHHHLAKDRRYLMDFYYHLAQEDRYRMEEDHYLSSDHGNLME